MPKSNLTKILRTVIKEDLEFASFMLEKGDKTLSEEWKEMQERFLSS